jgi:putative salt-induced outer membrane protein YdiY
MKRLTLPIIITALSTWTAGPAHAEKPIADGKWRGTASASLALTSGNSSTQAFLLNADVARLTAQDKISLSGYINEARSKADGKTSQTANKLGAAGRYDYNLSPQVFGFGALGLDRDGIIDLSLRTLVSTGVGYHLINTSTETFDVYGGVSFVDARYSSDQIIGDKTGRHFDTTGLV